MFYLGLAKERISLNLFNEYQTLFSIIFKCCILLIKVTGQEQKIVTHFELENVSVLELVLEFANSKKKNCFKYFLQHSYLSHPVIP